MSALSNFYDGELEEANARFPPKIDIQALPETVISYQKRRLLICFDGHLR